MISSILAATACFTVVSQANAAPHFSTNHAAQLQHHKVGGKFDNKHKHIKKKSISSQQKAKRIAAAKKAKYKYQGKNTHGYRSW